jgi:hypothetical protein
MIRPCKGEHQPAEEGRYLVFLRKRDRWDIAVWCGRGKGWALDGCPVNPLCWQPLPAQVRGEPER